MVGLDEQTIEYDGVLGDFGWEQKTEYDQLTCGRLKVRTAI